MVIELSLAEGRVLRMEHVRNGTEVTVYARRRNVAIKSYTLIVDDAGLPERVGSPHTWFACRDREGNRILLHVDSYWRVDRMQKTNGRHPNAEAQVRLPFAS